MQNRHRTITDQQHFSRCCWTLTSVFLLFLLGILIVFGYTPTNDGEGYIEYAQIVIADGQPYPTLNHIFGKPYIWNSGIINLVALSLWLTKSLIPLLVLLCVMKALTAWLLARSTAILFNERTALIALLLYILYPNNWGQSTMLSSEIPMVFFAMLAFYIIVKTTQKNNYPLDPQGRFQSEAEKELSTINYQLISAGAFLAFANWFRPVAAIFILAFIIYFVIYKRRNWLRFSANLIAGYLLIITIIGTSCYLRTGHFLYQADSLWFNMAEATYETDEQPHYNSNPFPPGTARYIDDMQHKTAIECSHIWRERSLQWLKQHPAEYLSKIPSRLYYTYKNDIDNLVAFLPQKDNPATNNITLPLGTLRTQFLQLSAVQYFALFCTVLYILLLLLAFGGTIRLINKHPLTVFLPLFTIVIGSLALALLIHGETRFKAPFMPFIFMLAACFFYRKRI